ncbi:hypothetical protein BV20DRAFT_954352 [Pilatotrama ljubarskyi]|nr:hypothetical protein BV20DRAFT_954352 [Pilatotrama ljubarskyi]
MYFKRLATALTTVTLAAVALAQAPLTIDTPALAVQCIPTHVQWHGGSGLFFLVMLRNDNSSEPIQEFGGLPEGTQSFLWQTNVAAGTIVGLRITDEHSDDAKTAPFAIFPGRTSIHSVHCPLRLREPLVVADNCTLVH